VIHRAVAALVGLGFVIVQPVRAQQSAKAAPAPKPTPAVPVPRTEFIQTMDREFGKMDADKNKIVTKAEIEQFQRAAGLLQARETARALFARMDADKNGQLSIAEFERMVIVPAPPNPAPILAQGDLNKDGQITLVEYRTAKLANFDRMDTDKDGIVSVAEIKAAGLAK
jgi:hypothetical protein